MIGVGLSLVQVAIRQMLGGFNPQSLFANGEIGAWYDPSDLSTLFQDAAGATPVTTASDPVGLMLDKSQGLVLGAEEVPNAGGPFVNTNNWTPTNSTLSVVDGNLRITGTGTFARAQASLTGLIVGATYKITITLVSTQGSDTAYWLSSGFVGQTITSISGSNTTTTFYATASATTGTLILYTTRNSDGTGEFSDWAIASIKELPGNHASQSTATARPLYQTSGGLAYLDFDGTDDFMVTSSFAWGSDEAFIAAGVTKDTGAVSLIMELSTSVASNAGSFYLSNGDGGNATTYGTASRGAAANNTNQRALSFGHTAPSTNVIASTNDISDDLTTLRVDGVAATPATGDKGAGNFGTYPLYIAARAGTSLFFNGRLYGAILRNLNPDAATIAQVEAYLAGKSGLTL